MSLKEHNGGMKVTSSDARARAYLGGGAWIVDAGGDEHATLAVDEERPVIVGDIEGLEELRLTLNY